MYLFSRLFFSNFLVIYSKPNSFSNYKGLEVVVQMNLTRAAKFEKTKLLHWLKKISAHFNHYDLINEEQSTAQFWYVCSIAS